MAAVPTQPRTGVASCSAARRPSSHPRCRASRSLLNPHLRPALRQSRRITHPLTVALARIPFHGSIRMGITTRPRCRMSNYQISITSKENWRAATAFMARVRTTKEIASPGALRRPTTATWRGNTGRPVRGTNPYSRTPDLPCSRDRRSRRTKSMISILLISPEGLYWVTPVPSTALTFTADDRTSTLEMTNVLIIDQPRWPAIDAETTPAFMDFKLVFKANAESVKYEDPSRQYRFEGFKAAAQLEATIRVPSIDFTFKTDELQTSSSDFAVMGTEVNGKYYEAAKA